MSWRDLRETGTLVSGVEIEGVVHRDFALRLPTVHNNIDAVELVGSHNGVALNVAILTHQLVTLGTLKPEAITFDLVCGMHPGDFNQLEEAAAALEKKRHGAQPPAPSGSASDSHSSASG